uniref:Structural maintenance of chromosomes flexible hinge domain containing 1 n=1 Tax=Sander lucioperca TaxID=283035 RepID=A0A8D0A6M4_SANLU
PLHETFVLVTTDRTVLDFDKFEKLQDDSTLHLLQREDQALAVATEEPITFKPHYNTLIRSGMYEYYASAGQKSLPYALAELIDNSISATAKNTGVRMIEIRMMFDETLGKPAVIVLDNGCGMTSKQLNNWAVYRLSKFSRENKGYVRPDSVPRSLNSDISYFGVGGKQAAFYIGDSTRMITKPVGSPDVHELVLSKEDFERKEKNKEDIYSGTIKNRKVGDSSHVNKDDEHFLHSLIAEESGKESFTAVIIMGVLPEHIKFLKDDFAVWTRQLAHTYHYYIHGADGKNMSSSSTYSDHLPNIDIQITLREKPPRCPRAMNLREVENDMQTLYINAAADTFEFKAYAEQNTGTVEGIIRYHPFLYDKETYPEDPDAAQASLDDDNDDNESRVLHQARRKRPIFNCFWNGRLIPYTTVSEFDWCSQSKGAKELAECYSRVSGVLFTDDRFMVSTNKLTFMELELILKNKDTIFTRIVNGQKQRGNIQKEFTQWLKNCHEKWDKQVKFMGYMETITRTDVPVKRDQYPWATFSSIEWDGNIYKTGQLVKSQKTLPILYGSVVRFLLYGKHDGNVFATGGLVEVALEPKAFHDKIKTIAISKIDKSATDEAIQKNIDKDFAKLPEILKVDWPEGNPWPQNAARMAGTPFGPIKIEILNKKGESLSKMPAVGQGAGKKLIIELKVVQHSPKGDQEVVSFVGQHSPKWGFWFKKIDKLTDLGKYTLSLNTMLFESNATVFGGKKLPSYKLNFTISGKQNRKTLAVIFVILYALSPSLYVGVPFNIPLLLKDGYDHPVMCPPDLKPVLTCRWVTPLYLVTMPRLKKDTQTVTISLLPGNPHALHVTPDDNPITVQNGNPVMFNVEIHDEAGNITANPKQIVRCQVQGFPLVATDCSTTGAGQLVTKPINLKMIKGEPQNLKVNFEMPSQKKMAVVVRELKVVPSTRVSRMELCSEDDENLMLRNNEKIEWLAGGLLENLFYKLYDEAGREVPPTAPIASKIKVNWTGDVNLEDLLQGKLPDVQVPTQVQEARFYQVSYQDQCVSVSFNIVPRPDEPTRLKATLLQSTLKLGEILPGHISEYKPNHPTIFFEDIIAYEMTHLFFLIQTWSLWTNMIISVLVTGVRFQFGTPGHREMCFTYKSYVERIIVKVVAGIPAQLKLVSGPEKPLQVLNDQGIATPFLVQLCDEWGNPTTDQRVVVELKSSPLTLKVSLTNMSHHLLLGVLLPSCSIRGYYQLVFKGSLNQKPIPGPSVNLTVIPDPTKPVSLSVEYDTNAKLPAGGILPGFVVNPWRMKGMTVFISGKMLLHPVCSVLSNLLVFLLRNINIGFVFFHCRDKEIPEHIGKHTIQFFLRINKTNVLYSNQIAIHVVANQPVKLAPDSQPPTPVVSYSEVIANRTLVENMTLRIMDSYGNPAGQDLEGKVVISIKNSSEEGNKSLPLFESKTNSFTMNLVEGKAHITRLAVMENSPGENGSTYVLLFNPQVSMVPTSLAPFELPFRFFNDAENQRKMSELSRKKDELTTALVGHLAFVQDDDAARVISWHIRGDMDCVITKTTEAAMKIFGDTQGSQQVMALDSVYVTPGKRPMPHIRNGRMLFDPPGNPVLARDLLIFTRDQESCNIAFKSILADTILIDDLNSGTNYRKAVVQNKMQCPTILTRQGDRISARGKFGGTQNKAPMNITMVFGAPLPQHYYTLVEHIDLISQHKLALEKRDVTAKTRDDHLKSMKSPEMLQKRQEMEEKKKQLEEIERQLGTFVDVAVRAEKTCIQSFCLVFF